MYAWYLLTHITLRWPGWGCGCFIYHLWCTYSSRTESNFQWRLNISRLHFKSVAWQRVNYSTHKFSPNRHVFNKVLQFCHQLWRIQISVVQPLLFSEWLLKNQLPTYTSLRQGLRQRRIQAWKSRCLKVPSRDVMPTHTDIGKGAADKVELTLPDPPCGSISSSQNPLHFQWKNSSFSETAIHNWRQPKITNKNANCIPQRPLTTDYSIIVIKWPC